MPIHGLTNQWKTYEALLHRFATFPEEDAPGDLATKYRMIRGLLAKIHGSTDSAVFVGTSHSTLNLGTHDAVTYNDWTQPFAIVDVVVSSKTSGEFTFRVETREIDRNRPTSKWIVCKTADTEVVSAIIRETLLFADVPQRQSEAIG